MDKLRRVKVGWRAQAEKRTNGKRQEQAQPGTGQTHIEPNLRPFFRNERVQAEKKKNVFLSSGLRCDLPMAFEVINHKWSKSKLIRTVLTAQVDPTSNDLSSTILNPSPSDSQANVSAHEDATILVLLLITVYTNTGLHDLSVEVEETIAAAHSST